jgi:SNF2 family DNA or RNA helicase
MLISKEKRAVVLRLRDPTEVLKYVPTARRIEHQGKELVAVPHRTTELQLLANLGIKNIPSPVELHYDWPGPYPPFHAQRETVKFLTMYRRAYCLNDLGTGKTMAAVWAYDWLRREKVVNKALVVAPLSTLEVVWADALFQALPALRVTVLYGGRAQRKKLLDLDSDVYVINHDGVKVLQKELEARTDINLVILDELSQVARNAGTDRWKAMRDLLRGREWAWGLTGTPRPNAATDAWAQCRLLTPHTVPPFFSRFRDETMIQVSQYKWIEREDAVQRVYQAMQPGIRFTRDACVDLPPVIYEERRANLTGVQGTAYNSMVKAMYAEYKGHEINAVNEGVKQMKLVQIACGAVYDNVQSVVTLDPGPRVEIVRELIDASQGKTIVFVPFRHILNEVASRLAMTTSVAVVHGGVSPADRVRIHRSSWHNRRRCPTG